MNPELREAIGKAVYAQSVQHFSRAQGTPVPWEDLLEDTREHYRLCGEKAVEALLQPIVPTLVKLTKSLVGLNQDQQDAIRHIVKTVTGKGLEEL